MAIAGSNHRLLFDSSSAWSYGPENLSGQLGNGNNSPSTYPTHVLGVGGVGTLGPITEVGAGLSHSRALDLLGNVTAWGLGTSGQLGNGGTTSSNVPVNVSLAVVVSQPTHC